MTSTKNFHQVTLSVINVARGSIARDEKQEITALVSVKLRKIDADKLLALLNEQLTERKEVGYIMFTLEGQFT